MSEENSTKRIFISAAEPSGDAHCAKLILAMKQDNPDIEFVGVGGSKMAEAGCQLLDNTAEKAVMIYKVVRHLQRYFKLIMKIRRFLKNNRIDLVIVCDSPAFNFHIARAAKQLDIKTLFYVAPQLWAWAPWRIKKLRQFCDKLCCILPFEEKWFAEKGIQAVFVGNPLLEQLNGNLDERKKSYENFNAKNATIVLVPGSRQAEIESLWRPMQQIANQIRRRFTGVEFVTAAVDEKTKELLKVKHILGFRCSYSADSVYQTVCGADFAIVASGSVTLQVAAAGCPMVIIYQSSKILWQLFGRWLIKTKHLSLVNILADRKIVPEFMPYFTSIEPITETVIKFLTAPEKLSVASEELLDTAKPLAQKNASYEVAKIASQMLD